MTESNGTREDQINKAILGELTRLGGSLQQEDALRFQGTSFILPETYAGNVKGAIDFLEQHDRQQEQEHAFTRVFKYRPFDGAAAFQRALKRVWGSTGLGKTTQTFFGNIVPEFISIETSPTTTTQVPWGRLSFPPLQADIYVGGDRDNELGDLFYLRIECPRKYRSAVEGLFKVVEEELRENSIYRGKVIDGGGTPGFIDPFRIDENSVVYSQEVRAQLNANVWSLVEHTDETRRLGLPLKRTVLLHGPYGTGKTLAATLTAQKTSQNGWTFVMCRAGQDDLQETLRTARLYAPAVVFFEDIDVIANNGDPEAITKLLDMFDGMTAKGAEIVVMLTTNHVERIQKGMLRPGRLDALIEIGSLDRDGFEKLIKATVSQDHLGDVDYDQVAIAFTGLLPAFAKEAIDRALRYQLARTGGRPGRLETQDFVLAAEGLRPQLTLMEDANEGVRTPDLDTALMNRLREAVNGSGFMDKDDNKLFYLDTTEAVNG